MKNKGYITFVVLIIFINISIILGVISNKSLKGMLILENLKKADSFLDKEEKVIRIIRNYLNDKKYGKETEMELEVVKENENEMIVVIDDFYYVIKYDDYEIIDFYIAQ